MKKILLLAILIPTFVLTTLTSSWAKPAAGVIHNFKVTAVKDGDTVVIEAPYLPAPLKQQLSIRVLGVDTPEKAPPPSSVLIAPPPMLVLIAPPASLVFINPPPLLGLGRWCK